MSGENEEVTFEVTEDPPIPVKIFGHVYNLRRPGFKAMCEVQSFEQSGDFSVSLKFLESLGIPSDVIDRLSTDNASAIVSHVCTFKKK